MQKKKIAIITQNPAYAGGVGACLDAAIQMLHDRAELGIFYLDFSSELSTSLKRFKFASSTKSYQKDGIAYHAVGARWAFWEPGHYQNTQEVWQELLAPYDLCLIVSGNCMPGLAALLAGKPYVLWVAASLVDDSYVRRAEFSCLRKLIDLFALPKLLVQEKLVLQNAWQVLGVSSYSIQTLQKIVPDLVGQVVGFPICDGSEKQVVAKNYANKIVLAVGRFSDPRKNFAMLLEVWKKVVVQVFDAQLILLGELDAEQKSQISKHDSILHTEHVDAVQKQWLYDLASIFVLTSYQEGLAIVGLEAALAGCALVMTDCGGVSDYLVDGQTGFLLPVNDVQSMAEKLVALLADPALIVGVGTQASQLVIAQFSCDQVAAKLCEALNIEG